MPDHLLLNTHLAIFIILPPQAAAGILFLLCWLFLPLLPPSSPSPHDPLIFESCLSFFGEFIAFLYTTPLGFSLIRIRSLTLIKASFFGFPFVAHSSLIHHPPALAPHAALPVHRNTGSYYELVLFVCCHRTLLAPTTIVLLFPLAHDDAGSF